MLNKNVVHLVLMKVITFTPDKESLFKIMNEKENVEE